MLRDHNLLRGLQARNEGFRLLSLIRMEGAMPGGKGRTVEV